MEIIKPELTEQEKQLGNKLYKFLAVQIKPTTKEQMCEYLGWEYNSSTERKIRMLLANIGKIKPLISTSNQKGYYIAKTKSDVEQAIHQAKEIDSRIAELQSRKAPLINFLEEYNAW